MSNLRLNAFKHLHVRLNNNFLIEEVLFNFVLQMKNIILKSKCKRSQQEAKNSVFVKENAKAFF